MAPYGFIWIFLNFGFRIPKHRIFQGSWDLGIPNPILITNFKNQTQFKHFLAIVCSGLPGGISALLCSWIIYRQFLLRGRPTCFVSEYKTPLPRFEIKQLSDKLKQDHTSNHLQHLDQRTKNIFFIQKTPKTISYFKNGNYQFKCHQRYENDPHSGKKCCKRFKNSYAGFVFWSRKSKGFFGQTSAEKHPKNHNLQYLE